MGASCWGSWPVGCIYQYCSPGEVASSFSASYDLLDRATDVKVKRTSDGATVFDKARGFDAAGNVSTINTTLPTGTDNQAGTANTADSLSAAAPVPWV